VIINFINYFNIIKLFINYNKKTFMEFFKQGDLLTVETWSTKISNKKVIENIFFTI